MPIILIPLLILAYLLGSLTPSIWVTKWVKGVDVRDGGSGHATTTNTIRQAGFGPGALVLAVDLAKGFLPTYLALQFLPNAYWAIPVAIIAVIGHCWPIFAGFRGGMGLATAGGALLANSPLALLAAFALLLLLLLIMRHAAKATIFTALLIAPLFWALGFDAQQIMLAAGIGLVIGFRFLSDWNRKYRELWLDREKPEV